MAELTIQVSDELAQVLEPYHDRLPELLKVAVEAIIIPSNPSDLLRSVANSTVTPLAYSEVLDFLLTRPTPQEIAAFKVSTKAQERIRILLDKNLEGITETEAVELDLYEQLEHLMILLKAKAYALI
jgi:hypothetical protein